MSGYAAGLEKELGGSLQETARPQIKEHQDFEDAQIPALREETRNELQAIAEEAQLTIRQLCEAMESRVETIFPSELTEEVILARSILNPK